jgi:hypothetical protein
MGKNKLVKGSIIGIFIFLYLMVSTISMINSFDFFHLSQGDTMAWVLAVSFELGSACSLASLIILNRINKTIVWMLFITLTSFQIMNNVYHTYINLNDFKGWIELFGLEDEEIIYQKRILSIISGAILPLISLGFIKSLVDYINPDDVKMDDSILLETVLSDDNVENIKVEEIKSDDINTESSINNNQYISHVDPTKLK